MFKFRYRSGALQTMRLKMSARVKKVLWILLIVALLILPFAAKAYVLIKERKTAVNQPAGTDDVPVVSITKSKVK